MHLFIGRLYLYGMWLSVLLFSGVLFIFGAVIGSFLNVVMYRSLAAKPVKKGEKWYKGRSRCDTCGQQIAWYDNIPLVSYIVLLGRCRYCRTPIGLSHPAVEILTGSLFVWWYWAGNFFFHLRAVPFDLIQPFFWLMVGLILLYIFLTDIEYFIIPDTALVLLTGLTIIYRVVLMTSGIMRWEDFVLAVVSMLGAVLFLGFLWFFTRGKGLGFGDVKLMIPLGLLLGWPKTPVMLFLAFLLGSVIGLGLVLSRKKTWKQRVPFGPFIIAATGLSLLWGDVFFATYLSWLGVR